MQNSPSISKATSCRLCKQKSHIRIARNGHGFARNIVIVERHSKKYVMVGDCAYVKGNMMGGNRNGVSVPSGFAVGSTDAAVHTLQDIFRYEKKV